MCCTLFCSRCNFWIAYFSTLDHIEVLYVLWSVKKVTARNAWLYLWRSEFTWSWNRSRESTLTPIAVSVFYCWCHGLKTWLVKVYINSLRPVLLGLIVIRCESMKCCKWCSSYGAISMSKLSLFYSIFQIYNVSWYFVVYLPINVPWLSDIFTGEGYQLFSLVICPYLCECAS